MKKTERLLGGLLMIVMLITSVGLLYASIYASGSGVHSTFSSVVFEKETGIRYNNLTREFEVFNEAGVSWIGSNRYISVDGKVENSSVITDPGDGSTHEKADANKTYNIMCDIAYSVPTQTVVNGEDIYNTSFDTQKITLGATGILDGRGFTLKNFKVATMPLETKSIGAALVATNNGIIRNLNVANADFTSSDLGNAAGIICGINNGTIDRSKVYGSSLNNTYETNKYDQMYGICAISSGKISNSTNNAHINNTKESGLAAGITGITANANLLNNINNGNITSTARASGIAIDVGGVSFIVRGNTNNGDLTAQVTVSGIIDGGIDLSNMDEKNNVNNANLNCDEFYELYYGVSSGEKLSYGIFYSPSLNGTGGFEIENADGISWMCSGRWFNELGDKSESQADGYFRATSSSFYKVKDDIEVIDFADKTENYNIEFNGGDDGNAPVLDGGGVFDGNDCLLTGFPIRRCSSGSTYYSALFERTSYEGGYQNSSFGLISNFQMHFNDTLTVESNASVGGVVAVFYLPSSTGGIVIASNVAVSGKIDCGSNGLLGGIFGDIYSWIGVLLNDVSAIDIDFRAQWVGGILGDDDRIDNGPLGSEYSVDTVMGKIVGSSTAGGIFSQAYGPSAYISVGIYGTIDAPGAGLIGGSVYGNFYGDFIGGERAALVNGAAGASKLFGWTV